MLSSVQDGHPSPGPPPCLIYPHHQRWAQDGAEGDPHLGGHGPTGQGQALKGAAVGQPGVSRWAFWAGNNNDTGFLIVCVKKKRNN